MRFSAFCIHTVSAFWVWCLGLWVVALGFKGANYRAVFNLLHPQRFNLFGFGFGLSLAGPCNVSPIKSAVNQFFFRISKKFRA